MIQLPNRPPRGTSKPLWDMASLTNWMLRWAPHLAASAFAMGAPVDARLIAGDRRTNGVLTREPLS